MSPVVQGEILVPGAAGEGRALVLTAPISFWGGVDLKSGRIADVRHPQCGETISGRVLFLPGTIGSSSASAVLMELVHSGHAPAALVLHEPDAILLLGLIVAREMGWQTPIAVRLDKHRLRRLRGLPGSGFAGWCCEGWVILSVQDHATRARLFRCLCRAQPGQQLNP